MVKSFLFASLLMVSANAWALECSTPVTLSDPRFDGHDPRVIANQTGEVAVVWISEEGHNEAIASSSRTDGNSWSSPQMLSDWERDIYKKRSLVNSEGDFFAVWEAEKEDGDVIQLVKKKQGGSWTFPFDWTPSISSFDFETVGTGHSDHLIFVGKSRETHQEKSPYGNYSLETTIHSVAIAGGSPFQTDQKWNILKQESGVYYLSCLGIVTNRSGLAYVFWRPGKSGSENLLCQKIENNQLIGEPEEVSSLASYSLRSSMNEKGDVVVRCYNSVIAKIDDVWSDITPLDLKEDDISSSNVSIDEAGNIMLVYDVDYEDRPLNDRYYFVKALYKPFGKEWHPSTLFSSSKADNQDPEVQPDGKGNFVVLWNQSQRNKNSIVGSVFSTENDSWTKPQTLSPTGEQCSDFSLTFFAPGKGYISWVRTGNGFDQSIQVAELSN